MATPEPALDDEFRQRVMDTMATVLARLLDRPEPVTEDMRLMEERGLSSPFGRAAPAPSPAVVVWPRWVPALPRGVIPRVGGPGRGPARHFAVTCTWSAPCAA